MRLQMLLLLMIMTMMMMTASAGAAGRLLGGGGRASVLQWLAHLRCECGMGGRSSSRIDAFETT